MAANARQSPLLRLSPEIRNRIYKLVLGGHEIHISAGCETLRSSICVLTHVDAETSDDSSGESRGSWLDYNLHEHCCPPSYRQRGTERIKLDVSLLQVCKQIHEEAALLPFASNTFLLQSISQLAWFSEHLLSAQRSAVTSIVLDNDDLMFVPAYWRRSSQAEKARLRRLTGVKKLRFNIENYWGQSPSIKELNSGLARWLEVLPLRSIDGATVRIRAPRSLDQENEGPTQAVPEAYADWCLEAEKTILQKQNK